VDSLRKDIEFREEDIDRW